MPTENRSSNTEQMVSVPRFIGTTRLDGSYYAAECTSCGWVGSSEDLTEDAQCTRIEGDHMCLADTDEIGTDRLLDIIQAMALPAAQHQGEPVAVVDEADDGLFIDIIYGEDGSPLRLGDKLYLHPPTSDGFSAGDMADQGAKAFAARDPEVEQLRAELDVARAQLTTQKSWMDRFVEYCTESGVPEDLLAEYKVITSATS